MLLIDSGKMAPQVIMDKDASLLETLDQPILHLYEWQGPSLTYGYFIDPYQHLSKEGLHKHNIAIARRPTGGGIIFHLTDFAFSILIPASHPKFSVNTLENYAWINQWIAYALQPFLKMAPELLVPQQKTVSDFFCMAKPTQFDILINGKKVGGAAQRRTKKGFLHQGSISLALPPEHILHDVIKREETIREMKNATYSFLDHSQGIEALRHQVRACLVENVCGC